ncbi:hypothetical protein GCM10010376_69380 [Streptomyces violaceusniger]
MTVLAGAVTADAVTTGAITAIRLRTDHLTRALGIDDTTPALSWQLSADAPRTLQSAYRVQAAGSLERLRASRPDLWDSGKVDSAVPETRYAGRRLGSRARVYWRVMLWSGRGHRPSGWSQAAVFETGLTRRSDGGADWITHPAWRLSRHLPPTPGRAGLRSSGTAHEALVARSHCAMSRTSLSGQLVSSGPAEPGSSRSWRWGSLYRDGDPLTAHGELTRAVDPEPATTSAIN